MTYIPDEVERLLQAFGKQWPAPPFSCLGADHIDTVLQLQQPAVRNRTNPVKTISIRQGGVAANIARYFALLGGKVRLYAPRPLFRVENEKGIERIALYGRLCDCSYTAVLDSDGELEIGLAAMDDYDELDESSLPEDFPGDGPQTLVIDAAFQPDMIQDAANRALNHGWQVMGAGTSPAKVGKLRYVDWDALVLNEAEAAVWTGQKMEPAEMAKEIAMDTGGAVAVTCGAKGACLFVNDATYHQSAPPISVSNANGAGDAFSATFFACLAAKAKPHIALRLAVSAGALYAEGKHVDQNSIGDALRKKYLETVQFRTKGFGV